MVLEIDHSRQLQARVDFTINERGNAVWEAVANTLEFMDFTPKGWDNLARGNAPGRRRQSPAP
jgi:hypothetical protein